MMERSAGAVLLETERLVLRHFTMSDVGNLADLDADPDVMRFIAGGLATSRGGNSAPRYSCLVTS